MAELVSTNLPGIIPNIQNPAPAGAPRTDIPIVVNSQPTGPRPPAGGGWRCVLAEGFNSQLPLGAPYSLFAPNRNNNAGLPAADSGGFNQNEVEVFNASQALILPDGVHLRASSSPAHISPAGSVLTGTANLSAALATGAPITSLPITALAGAGLANGAQVVVQDPGCQHAQVWTLTAAAAANAVTLTVASQTPNFAYPAGSTVSAIGYVSGCLSSQPATPVGGETGWPITGFSFLPAAGISWAFEIVCQLPAATMPGGDMAFWAISQTGTNEIDFMEWTNYDPNLAGVWDFFTSWIDHAHNVAQGGQAFSNSYPLLSAQTDGNQHRWTAAITASDNQVHTYLDGVEILTAAYPQITGYDTGPTDYLRLVLSHALRNAYTGKNPAFTGSSDVIVRSVAAYQDLPHLGQNINGGGTAPGTIVV